MRFALLIWLLVCAATLTLAQATEPARAASRYAKPADIPIGAFFRRAEYSQMAISPDGNRLAAVRPINGRDNLVVIDFLAGKLQVISNFKELDVVDFVWVSNDRLYFRSADLSEVSGATSLKGAYAVDVDGKNIRDLTFPLERTREREARRNSILVHGINISFRILSQTFDGSGDVIAEIFGRSQSYADVYRFNTRTGEYKLLTVSNARQRCPLGVGPRPRTPYRHPPGRAQGSHEPARADYLASAGRRKRLGDDWPRVRQGKPGQRHAAVVRLRQQDPLCFVQCRPRPEGNFQNDIAQRKLGEKLLEHPLIDLNGGLIFSRTKKALVGIRYSANVPVTTWFDEDLARLQAALDKALPERTNAIDIADENSRYVLIYSVSDTNPGGYFLYDTEKRSLQEVSKSREWLPPALMSKRSFIKYKARDGREIPAWVTTPIDSDGKDLPLVVHIHGGPWVRGYSGIQWGRWPVAQFLASRGYAVLEPEPRGSTGFGRSHYTASFKQWGLAMQDDISDGALYLVKEGIVDKGRMCLFGGSYGGYATLQGLVKDPDLWRCGVA
ncbi:MAG: S9 family peptidase [Betaproteobacteria bacterium]|nr:S9 family peptidase [Betaproteobacteria bacterium]